ncbi:MAG TPA: tetratricopeptide repeat protein [Longimicrobiales bacterium]|nr:tetratricopeptide repeat protein [Longimicrobiales bacterium]
MMRERTKRRQAPPERPAWSRLTFRQRILLGVWALALPVLLVGLLEAGLRTGGYGSSYPLFIRYGGEAPDMLVPNPEVARRYFPGPEPAPLPPTDLFHADKAPGTLRLFVQGASSAAGFPYSYGAAFSRMLEQRLQDGDPTRTVEVVNTAITAVNSYTLVDFADEIIAQRPDAVLVYAGHNEYYGVFGVGSSVSLGRSSLAVRGYLLMVRWRSVQLLRAALTRLRPAPDQTGPEASRTLMERLAGNRSIPYGGALHEAGIRQWRANLRRLLARYRDAGVPVFVATLASNERDLAPFVGGADDAESREVLEAQLRAAHDRLAAGDTAGALAALQEGVARLPDAADAHYALAQLLDRSGEHERARQAYLAAKDRDGLPFRAPEAVNDVIREEAARSGATVVDVQRHFAEASPQGIIGERLILEHVHPNITGQFLIADAFYEALVARGIPGGTQRHVPAEEARPRVPVTALDSIAGTRIVERLMAGFPFRGDGQGTPPAFPEPRGAEEGIALAFVTGRVNWIDAQIALRSEYRKAGRLADALHVDLVLAQELAFSPDPLVQGGAAALALGDAPQAERLLLEAGRRRPIPDALRMLAGIRASAGDAEGARGALGDALRIAPEDQRVQLALRALGEIPGLEREVQDSPRDVERIANLGSAYYVTAQFGRAREMAARALALDPDHEGALTLKRRADEFFGGAP